MADYDDVFTLHHHVAARHPHASPPLASLAHALAPYPSPPDHPRCAAPPLPPASAAVLAAPPGAPTIGVRLPKQDALRAALDSAMAANRRTFDQPALPDPVGPAHETQPVAGVLDELD